jgi:rRNA-processing protein EBP2
MGKKIKSYQKEKGNKTAKEIEKEEDIENEKELANYYKKLNNKNNTNDNNNNDNNDNEEEKEIEDELNESDSIESINLAEELNEKIKEIKLDFKRYFTEKNKEITWLEKPVLMSKEPIDQNINLDDDIKRELLIYNITKENAIKGLNKLKELKEKLNRPDDYFVEMLKSDEQMENVKKQIIREQTYIKKFEQKKQKFQNIKFAKSIKDFQNKEKSAFKKRTLEGIEKWKQHIKHNPNDYNNIDKFFDGDKKKKKFNPKQLAGKSVKFKSKEKRINDMQHFKKKQNKRHGKVKRMQMRNKKNSKKNK